MKGKRQAWKNGERSYFVTYVPEGQEEEIAKPAASIRDAHRLCLAACELGFKASLLVSQRVSPVDGDGDVDVNTAQPALFGEGAAAEEEGA
jgi:hypothetical protein